MLAAAVALVLLAALLRRLRPAERPLPYYARKYLLSNGEVAFYHALRRGLPDGLLIAVKVRLADVIGCDAEAWRKGFGGRIAQKHVDFVLADAGSTATRLVIELDDRTHQRSDRRRRDDFVDRALAAAGVPLLRVPAAAKYDPAAIRVEILRAFAKAPRTASAV